MIKKRYMVVAVAVVSIILGSLLYNNLVSAGKPQPEPSVDQDAVEITVLDWSMRDKYYPLGNDHLEQGILCAGYSSTLKPVLLPFVLNPKDQFLNVTDLWVTFVMADDSGTTGYQGKVLFRITINGQNTFANESQIISGHIQTVSVRLENPLIHSTIHPNINTISLELDHIEIYELPQQNWYKMWVYQMTVFIEYEYEA